MSLRECPGCLRHVKSKESSPFAAAKRNANGEDQAEEETVCPFCSVALAAVAPVPAGPALRLGRAAIVALGASASIACENPVATRAVYGGPPPPAATDAGAPAPDAAVEDAAPAPLAPPDAGRPQIRVLYGAPPVRRNDGGPK